jgi:hypothetical protein
MSEAEPFVVPTVLASMASMTRKPRELRPGDGVVYHDGTGRQVMGTVVFRGRIRVAVQIAGGQQMRAATIKWEN